MRKVKVKMEFRQYVEEIYWIEEEIEIPDEENDVEDYLKNGISLDDFNDKSNCQITVQEEERTIELIENVISKDYLQGKKDLAKDILDKIDAGFGAMDIIDLVKAWGIEREDV